MVLAIDTATPRVSVALGGPDGIVGSFDAAAGRRHAETLAPAIRMLSDATGVALADIDRVAVDIGPGLFTGLRVGLATAAALASALGRPAYAACSLDLLALPYAGQARPVAAIVDARRAEVFWALYLPGEGRLGEPAVAAPEELATVLAGLGVDVLAVGDGALRYAALLQGSAGAGEAVHPRVEVRPGHPSALDLVTMAAAAGDADLVAPGLLRPLYLRQADVRIGWTERAPQAVAP